MLAEQIIEGKNTEKTGLKRKELLAAP